jgi:hypothetical protein
MRRAALTAIVAGNAAIAIVYTAALAGGAPPAWSGMVFAVATALMLVALMVLGAHRTGARFGMLWLAFAFAFLIMAGGFMLALVLPPEEPGAQLLLGLPRRAAIIMYGIGLLPAFIIPAAYAVTFDRLTLSEEDLRRVRAARSPDSHTHGGAA